MDNTKVIHQPLVGGLLHLVDQGDDCRLGVADVTTHQPVYQSPQCSIMAPHVGIYVSIKG